MKTNLTKYFIDKNADLKTAIKKLDHGEKRILFVIDENNQLVGAITDGDFRRHIVKTGAIEGIVYDVCKKTPTYVHHDFEYEIVKQLMISRDIFSIPVVNADHEIVEIIFWDELFKEKKDNLSGQCIGIPAVIMAGGKGTRLDPFTRILPKPLIPIGDTPIIKIIINEYTKYGISDFYISIHHQAKIIKAYFEEYKLDYKISFVEELEPLGTAGALKMLTGRFSTPFFVSNCDIIIKDCYPEILKYHLKDGCDLTIVSSLQHYTVPYGVCEIEKGGTLKKISEKPEYDFFINTGMYIMSPEILDYIPTGTRYDITDLIRDLQKANKKIGVYPVSEKSWIDIGQWGEYKKTLSIFLASDPLTN
jgi:dTDP-glucose pyrophosphorylase/CBS domain-containing protein